MSEAVLREIRDLIQVDVNRRGLATDPEANLINACPDDFAASCRSIAETAHPSLCVVTGFFIAHADPPCGETDGPLGALFLARALTPLGIRVALITDAFCKNALQVGLETSGLRDASLLGVLPPATQPWDVFLNLSWEHFRTRHRLSHLIALERVGPSHTSGNSDSFYSMRGLDVSSHTCPAHRIFEQVKKTSGMRTIGIGDGGNEIGMGKIPHDVIARNVPNGGLIACRVPTDHLIVCGVSNWGAYALAAGVALLRGETRPGPVRRGARAASCSVSWWRRGRSWTVLPASRPSPWTGCRSTSTSGRCGGSRNFSGTEHARSAKRHRGRRAAGRAARRTGTRRRRGWPAASSRPISSSCRATSPSISCSSASATPSRVRCWT